ncbi:hypothetical protein GY45DRAFT_1342286 [Cubamyces sp. BRFM 1775]|nr:hypothetical protein GY45DRAFT_1342286 [Cubamyces sp. BRFM 1775]
MTAATGFNVSSVVLRSYPECVPWDIDPEVYSFWPTESVLKEAALVYAQRTKLNPLHFMCMNNPFVLDRPDITQMNLPFTTVGRIQDFEAASIEFIQELYATNEFILYRVCLKGVRRLLNLYFGPTSSEQFDAESAAYARLLRHDTSSSGAVLRCHGWMELDLRRAINEARNVISDHTRDMVNAHASNMARGIILYDLPGAEALSIHNITPELAQDVLRSLHRVHAAYVLQGSPSRHCILVSPTENRAVWVDFGHALCDLAELAEAWHIVFQRLVSAATISLANLLTSIYVDPCCLDRLGSWPGCHRSPDPHWNRSASDEIEAILFSYPETDLFSWDPPVSNLTPTPRFDHRFDTAEFLKAVRIAKWQTYGLRNPLYTWYGMCPLVPSPRTYEDALTPGHFRHYVPPPPLPRLSSDTAIRFLEHVRSLASHPPFKVRIGDEEWLMKVNEDNEDDETAKKRFEMERDAYAHLMHYGACVAGAAPQCLGWIELSCKHVYDAIDMIRRTRDSGTLPEDEELAWVSPIFEDGSVACALIIEYIEDAEPLSHVNLTMGRMDLILRSLARVHGCYVQHDDLENWNNVLIVRGRDGKPDRAVLVDFDHAMTPGNPHLGPRTNLNTLTTFRLSH